MRDGTEPWHRACRIAAGVHLGLALLIRMTRKAWMDPGDLDPVLGWGQLAILAALALTLLAATGCGVVSWIREPRCRLRVALFVLAAWIPFAVALRG